MCFRSAETALDDEEEAVNDEEEHGDAYLPFDEELLVVVAARHQFPSRSISSSSNPSDLMRVLKILSYDTVWLSS